MIGLFRMSRLITFVLLLLLSFNAFAIVKVGNLRFDDSNLGFKGNFNAYISGASGNTDKSSWHLGSNLVWRQSKYINLFLLGYDYGESNREINANKTFAHLRHIRRYNKVFDWELFAQLEQDEFTRLTRRELLGAGLRFLATENSLIGLGVFRFKEKLDEIPGTTDKLNDDGFRLNSYWSGDYKLNETSSITARFYYQPKIDDIDDTRVLFDGFVDVKVLENLSIKLSIGYTHDSKPPQGVEQTDITYRSGFEYNFE